jgi:serine/threonine-protein kinase
MADTPSTFGRFNVTGTLGQGAMGVVYRAEDPILGRQVAIKVVKIHDGLSEDVIAELSSRFENEARSAAALSHPNLVPIYDAGTQDGALYLAMEYVAGEGLDSVLKSDRVLTYKEVADLVLQIGSALDYVHERGIVHRDIKPANILLTRAGVPKITDFGVARQASSELTATGTILGTPAYMSPEQITGHEITGASDQFSLATVLYEMLTHRRPFEGEGATTILYKIVHEQPPAPDEIRSDVPRASSTALLRGLSKNPAERFPTCVEFAEAVRNALGAAEPEPAVALATGAAIARPPSTPGAAPPAPTPAWWARLGLSSPLSPLLLAGVAGTVIVVALMAAWGTAGGSGDTSPVASPPGTTPDSSLSAPAGAAAEIDEGTGTISFRVTSQPVGAEVVLDGAAAGPTPIDLDLDPARSYSIRLTADGYSPVDWAFTVANLTEDQQQARTLFFPLQAETTAATPPVAEPADLAPVNPVRIRGNIEAPTIIEKSEPELPAWAVDEGLPSYIVLELVVDEQGYVRDARVLREVHPILEEMALDAVRSWRLEPATNDGEPVAVFFNATVAFRNSE